MLHCHECSDFIITLISTGAWDFCGSLINACPDNTMQSSTVSDVQRARDQARACSVPLPVLLWSRMLRASHNIVTLSDLRHATQSVGPVIASHAHVRGLVTIISQSIVKTSESRSWEPECHWLPSAGQECNMAQAPSKLPATRRRLRDGNQSYLRSSV